MESTSILERCLHNLKVLMGITFMKLLCTTHTASTTEIRLELLEKLPLKKKANSGYIFAC